MHDLSYQYIGVALALLLAFGNTVARWGGVIYGACTPPCLGRIVVRFFSSWGVAVFSGVHVGLRAEKV